MQVMDSSTARANFELANDITAVSNVDAIFKYDRGQQTDIRAAEPWAKE